MSGESLPRSVGWLALGSVATRAVGAVSAIVSARALGVDGRGGLAVVLVLGMLAGGILPLGLDLWAARTLGGGESIHSVVALLRRHCALVTLLVIGAGAAALLWSDKSPGLIAATVALCISGAVMTLKLGVLQGCNQMRRYSVAAFASTAIFVVGIAGLAVTGTASVTSFVLAATAGQTVAAAWPVGRRAVTQSSETAAATVGYRRALRFGLPTAAGAVAAMLLYRLDVVLLTWWSDLDSVGLYSVALAVTEVVWVVPTAAAQALIPRASRGAGSFDTAQLSRLVVVFMVATSIAVAAAAPVAIPLLFGEDFDGAVAAVPLLTLAAIGVGVWKLIGHDLIARGNARARLWTGVAAIVLMVGVDAVLIPAHGLIGAAVGAAVAYLVAAGLVLVAWRAATGGRIIDALAVRRSDLDDVRRRVRERGSKRSRKVRGSSAT